MSIRIRKQVSAYEGGMTITLLVALATASALDHTAVGPVPATDPRTWITVADFPADAPEGTEGFVEYELTVNAQGKILKCSGHDAMLPAPAARDSIFVAKTCELLSQRARFQAAKGENDRNVDGVFRGRQAWSRTSFGHGQMISHPLPVVGLNLPSAKATSVPVVPRQSTSRTSLPTPVASPNTWISAINYPAAALREKRDGIVRFSLRVGTDGRVQACEINGSSGHADLDAMTCAVMMRRGRFKAATDASGNAVVGQWSSQYHWILPN